MTAHAPSVVRAGRIAIAWPTVAAIALPYLATRLIVVLIIFVSSVSVPMREGQFTYADANNLVLDGLVRYDSWWYADIVLNGYHEAGVTQANTAFFPLYPVLVSLAAGLTGNIFVAGVLVSHLALLAALCALYALLKHEFDEPTARRGVLYLAAAPTSVFFSAMYTESLFVALVVLTLLGAQRKRWIAAGVCGALAAATRNTGMLLAGVLVLEALHAADPSGRAGRWRTLVQSVLGGGVARLWRARSGLLAALIVPLGLLAFMGTLAGQFGDPLAFLHAQVSFGRVASAERATGLLAHTLTRLNVGASPLAGQISARALLDLLFTLGFGAIAIMALLRLRPAYGAFTALTLLVPLASGTLSSMTRYVLMLVPCFILLAVWGRREWVDRLVLLVFLPLMAYFTFLFSHWYFAG